jgi:ankyrin repeat protein
MLFPSDLENRLFIDIVNKNMNEVKGIVEANPAIVNAIANDGWSILEIAIRHSSTEAAKFLIDKGANVNHAIHGGRTPLHIVATTGNVTIAKLLLEKGANINAQTEAFGLTPLHYAITAKQEEIAKFYIERGADINIKENVDGKSAIHFAAEKGFINTVKLLLKKGANINSKDDKGKTPIEYAYSGKRREMAVYLLSKGAELPQYSRTKKRATKFVVNSIQEYKDMIPQKYSLRSIRAVSKKLNDESLIDKVTDIITEIENKRIVPIFYKEKETEQEVTKEKPTTFLDLPQVLQELVLEKAKLRGGKYKKPIKK